MTIMLKTQQVANIISRMTALRNYQELDKFIEVTLFSSWPVDQYFSRGK